MPYRAQILLGVALSTGLSHATAAAVPRGLPPDGRAGTPRMLATEPAATEETGTTCVLPAVRNAQYSDPGFIYFFNCEGDEIARRVEFNACISGSSCRSWYPRTVTLAFWISASECAGAYPYTTAPFEAQIAIIPADPSNPVPACPRPGETPSTMGPVFTVPALTRTDPGGADALVEVSLPVYGDCVRGGPFFVVFRWIGVSAEDDPCADAACVGRLPGLLSTGLCETPACDGPHDPVDTHAPCATYYRNAQEGLPDWYEAGDIGIRSDISLSIDMACCDAVGVERSTWGRIKSLSGR